MSHIIVKLTSLKILLLVPRGFQEPSLNLKTTVTIKALPKHKKYSLHPNYIYMYLDTLSLIDHLSWGKMGKTLLTLFQGETEERR